MPFATADRGAILHFAGRHGLSPALRDGAPALTREQAPGASRCGWEPFFAALGRSGPALLTDDADPSAARPVPSADRPPLAPGAAWAEALRFLAALRTPDAGPKAR
jgi:hypothetical protein